MQAKFIEEGIPRIPPRTLLRHAKSLPLMRQRTSAKGTLAAKEVEREGFAEFEAEIGKVAGKCLSIFLKSDSRGLCNTL